MQFKSTHLLSPLLAAVALLAGIWSGRSVRATSAEQQDQPPRFTQAIHSQVRKRESVTEFGRADEKTASVNPKEFIVVPPEAFRKIRVALLDGTSLDHKECQVLGLSETQIQKLEQLVGETVNRWREREKATMKIIPSNGPGTLIHIPAADREVSELEFKDLHEKILNISGEELGPLLHYRLTDGHSPSQHSNSGTGMLNVLTAGYGTMDRFVSIKSMPDGSTSYQIIDVLPRRMDHVGIDEALFRKLLDSGNWEEHKRLNSNENSEQLSHLLQHP
ncbi:MAG: hypothetical protein ACRCXD_11375 [Luteolibacter sp.]